MWSIFFLIYLHLLWGNWAKFATEKVHCITFTGFTALGIGELEMKYFFPFPSPVLTGLLKEKRISLIQTVMSVVSWHIQVQNIKKMSNI